MTEPGTDRQPAASSKRGRLWKWTKRAVVGIAGLVLFLLVAGVIYQFVATEIDESNYPSPGALVDVGGHDLHLYCTGEGGAPTVVMDSALGGGMLDWQRVQPEVSKFARVCTYDRAGVGWSEPGPQPRTSQQIVEELHTLLGKARVRGPYVLVGHSFGGTNTQVYASRYPDEVAGMVLVDSALEEATALLKSVQPSPVLVKILATIGVTRLPYTLTGETRGLTSPDLEDEQEAIYSHRKHLFAFADETSSLEESFDGNRAKPMSLEAKPLIVLTAGPLESQGTGLSQEELNQLNEAHTRTQAALTQRSQNSEQIVAKDSGHYIHVEQPETVIDAIRRVVEAARNDGSLRRSGRER